MMYRVEITHSEIQEDLESLEEVAAAIHHELTPQRNIRVFAVEADGGQRALTKTEQHELFGALDEMQHGESVFTLAPAA